MEKKNFIKQNKPLVIFVSVFVSVVLAFTLILGTVTVVKNINAAVSYEGLTMNREEASFFVSYYKYRYMSMLSQSGVEDVRDTPYFWSLTDEQSGKTYGQLLSENTELYLRQVLAANYLYDNYSDLDKNSSKKINSAVDDILTYKAEGSKTLFNEMTQMYGFDFSSFKSAVKLLYKAETVKNIIFGIDGVNMPNYSDYCLEYLETYSHVQLFFIRTGTEFVVDEDGNRVKDEDGQDKLRPLTDEEKAERNEIIGTINSLIDGFHNDSDLEITVESYLSYQNKYDDGDVTFHNTGYYFSKNSAYTLEFSGMFPEVVESALSMQIGDFSYVDTSIGVCYIYKYEVVNGDYTLTMLSDMFEDFYRDGSTYIFETFLDELVGDVVFKEKYNEIDIIKLPYNSNFLPRFE